jgi:Zn-dependent metalloprotease
MKRAQALVSASAAAALVLVGLTSSGSVQASSGSAGDDGHGRVGPTVSQADRHALVAARVQQVQADEEELRIGPHQDLVVKDVITDPDGMQHVRYDRTYDGLPVIGGDLVLHENPDGSAQSVSWATLHRISLPSTAASRSTVPNRSLAGSAKKVVFAAMHEPVLAWESHLTGTERDGTPIDELVYTDARTGKRLGVRQNIFTDVGTGNSLYAGRVSLATTVGGVGWNLTDRTRGGHSTYDAKNSTSTARGALISDADNTWGNGAVTSRQSAAVDAHYGAAATWDFYKTVFARNGIADNGVAAYSRVHFGSGYNNAFWDNSCFCMTYGDGGTAFGPLVSLDVAGHEMTHGVTAATDGLDYWGDAGGLNEASSDVMGTMVEFFANNASDPGDYYIGEKVTKNGTFIRRMDRPSADGTSVNCYSSTVKNLDPHRSSGVGNHLFYLLSEGTGAKTIGGRSHSGTSCNSTQFTGVGRDVAAKIWYRAMTTYWTSTTTYPRAANGMIKGARDLYGRNSATCKKVVTAWRAVKVTPTASCDTAAEEFTGAANISNPGFESGVAGWAQSQTGIITQSVDGAFPHSGSWFAWLGGYAKTHVDRLSHANVKIPVTKTARLKLYLYSYTDDPSFSPGDKIVFTLTYGTTTKVTKTLRTYYDIDASGAYDLKVFDLTPYAGKTVTIRATATNNNDGFASGWFIDDVAVKVTTS